MSSDATDNTMRAACDCSAKCGDDPRVRDGTMPLCAPGQKRLDERRERLMQSACEWRPIETAPKDGTNVLLVNRRGNMAAGLWMESLSGTGWYLRGSSRGPDVFFNSHHGPTHWMPLPAPPHRRLPVVQARPRAF